MPPHVKRRSDRGGTFYLIDGRVVRSLKTKVRRYAEVRLEQYVRGQFGLGPKITVREYYERWIETKKEPLVRRSTIRDYRQHWTKYLLPTIGSMRLAEISPRELQSLQNSLVIMGLAPKTLKNILAGSFRALWRNAMAEEIVDKNPCAALRWPRAEQLPPNPFTAEERDKILAYVQEKQPFYYPFVYAMFMTGMRPSEAVALRLSDVDLGRRTISITKSRHLDADAKPKTSHSRRLITVPHEVINLIEAIRLPWQDLNSYVFYNKFSGGPLNANQWARIYWKDLLKGAGVRHRKFYCTRHTFITEMVQKRENMKAIADYCGTSPERIYQNYCGPLELESNRSETVQKKEPQTIENKMESNLVPTGIEPATQSKDNLPKLINARLYERLRKAQGG